jgi:hypothetical protein
MNANAVAGLSAFTAAAAACLRVSLRRDRSAALWGTLAALHATWALEILLDLRYRFRAAIIPLLQDRGWYASRTAWQVGAIAMALLIGTALAAWLWRRHRDDGGAALGAITGTVLALMLLVVETISLHRVDAVMYAEAGPLVLLAWAWVGAAAIVIASALASSPDRSRSPAGTRARAAGRDG